MDRRYDRDSSQRDDDDWDDRRDSEGWRSSGHEGRRGSAYGYNDDYRRRGSGQSGERYGEPRWRPSERGYGEQGGQYGPYGQYSNQSGQFGSYGQSGYDQGGNSRGSYGPRGYGQTSGGYGEGGGSGRGGYAQNYGQSGQGYGQRGGARGFGDSRWGNENYGRPHESYGRGSESGWGDSARSGEDSNYRPYAQQGEWSSLTTTLRGGFAGKGPRGYTRSDDRIREDVCDRLSLDDELDASDITVTVSQGEVSLEGTVPDRRSKRRAEDISESVNGVQEVHNRLRSSKGLMQEVGDKLMGRATESGGHAGSGTRNTTAGSTPNGVQNSR